jgi:hypothetical protein
VIGTAFAGKITGIRVGPKPIDLAGCGYTELAFAIGALVVKQMSERIASFAIDRNPLARIKLLLAPNLGRLPVPLSYPILGPSH